MANTDKNIVITPNLGSANSDPQIVFSGANANIGPQNITLYVYPASNGTLSFAGSSGELFSITNDLTNSIFSVNDISGVPSIEVYANGDIFLAPYSGNIGIGNIAPAHKLSITGTLNVSGNANVGNIGATIGAFTNVSGNGSLLTSITGANVTGTVANATYATSAGTATSATTAGTVTTNAQPNITSVGTLTSVSVSGNANVGNIGATNGVFTNVSGNGASLSSITGANVTGTVANATYAVSSGSATSATTAGTVTTNAQPNITSVGTLTSVSVSGNANVGNLGTAGLITATGNIQGGNLRTGGVLSVTGNANVGNLGTTGVFATTLSATGNANVGNIGATNGVFTNVSGNGAGLSSITGANVTGTVANATYATSAGSATSATTAGTVTTNAQPNITSVGTLTSLSVSGTATLGTLNATNGSFSGNAIINGNLYVNGNLSYLNVDTLTVDDPIIQLQTGPNGAALTSNTGKDVGTALNYYDTTAKVAFMGWDMSNSEIAFGSNVSITNEVVTFTSLANTRSGNVLTAGVFSTTLSATGNANVGNIGATNGVFTNISGNGAALTSINGANVTGTVANATYAVSAGSVTSATTAGTVTTNAQPNITSVGTLTSLSVSGNANVGNIGAINGVFTNVSGNGASLTSITGANVTGTVANATYATSAGTATSATSATTAGTVTTNAQPNITSVGTLTSLSVSGNANVGNIGASLGAFTNVSGNGSLLTNINGANVTGTVASATAANIANHLSGGSAGTIPYQSAANVTAMLAAGTAGYFLKANGAAAPAWAELSLTDIPDAWVKKSVRVATTANITLSGTQTIDGIAVIAGDRVLVKNQSTASQNGIYVVAAGAWSRSPDANTISELAGAMVNVDSGTVNGGYRYDTDLKTTDTLDTTAVNFFKVLDLNDADSAASPNKVVLRDAFGNFGTNTITLTTLYAGYIYSSNIGVGTSGLSAIGNIITENVVSATGNVIGNYFIGNGSQLTGVSAALTGYTANVGNGVANTFTLTHNLNKQDIYVSVREYASGYIVYPDIKYSNANAIVVEFVSAPTANQYRVSVIGF